MYMYAPIDDFMMNNLHEFSGRKLVTAEMSGIDADGKTSKAGEAAKGMS